jgi:hypothetical protein
MRRGNREESRQDSDLTPRMPDCFLATLLLITPHVRKHHTATFSFSLWRTLVEGLINKSTWHSTHINSFNLLVSARFVGGKVKAKKNAIEGCFPLWPKVEKPLIFTNRIVRNQDFGFSTLRTMAKVRRLSQF